MTLLRRIRLLSVACAWTLGSCVLNPQPDLPEERTAATPEQDAASGPNAGTGGSSSGGKDSPGLGSDPTVVVDAGAGGSGGASDAGTDGMDTDATPDAGDAAGAGGQAGTSGT